MKVKPIAIFAGILLVATTIWITGSVAPDKSKGIYSRGMIEFKTLNLKVRIDTHQVLLPHMAYTCNSYP